MPITERLDLEGAAAGDLLACLQQAVLLVDDRLRVVATLGELPGVAVEPERLAGRRVEDLFADGLLAPGATLRRAVERGLPQRGWVVAFSGASRRSPLLACLSTAPLAADDPRPVPVGAGTTTASHALLLRPLCGADGGAPFAVFGDSAARSLVMRRLFRRARELDGKEDRVFLVGERGTGKELLARALHAASRRRDAPFVTVGCATLPERLVESGLFGHARGAFPGAMQDRSGALEEAAGGTLFLDQVDELPPVVQAGLLKTLRQRSFHRLGEHRLRRLDLRLVATGGSEPESTPDRRYLNDLHHELAGVVLHLPPLRHRPEDVEPMVAHFLARASARDGVPWRLSGGTLGRLLRHPWPGNAAELESVLEHACAVATPPLLRPDDLPDLQPEPGWSA